MKSKKFKYDGRSRPSDNKYRKNFDRIFGKREKTLSEMLHEGFEKEQAELKKEEDKEDKEEVVGYYYDGYKDKSKVLTKKKDD